MKPARVFWLVLLVFWGYVGVYAWTHGHASHVAKPLPAGVVTTCPTNIPFTWLRLPDGTKVLCGHPPNADPTEDGWGANLPEPGDVPVTNPSSGSRPAPAPGTCPADMCSANPNPLPPNQRPKA